MYIRVIREGCQFQRWAHEKHVDFNWTCVYWGRNSCITFRKNVDCSNVGFNAWTPLSRVTVICVYFSSTSWVSGMVCVCIIHVNFLWNISFGEGCSFVRRCFVICYVELRKKISGGEIDDPVICFCKATLKSTLIYFTLIFITSLCSETTQTCTHLA